MPENKFSKSKFFRDAVHDLIKVSFKDKFLVDIIDSSPFQRLRRIKQLGFVHYVYPSAQHSRFSHSLGCYHLANRIIEHLNSEKKQIEEKDRKLILVASLLHDIGHGPFSHIFESVLEKMKIKPSSHEDWGWEIISKSYISDILLNNGLDLRELEKIFNKTFKPKIAISIISSQFDVDRIDYLLRDSLMTGCRYARLDLEWIIRNLQTGLIDPKNEPENIDIAIDGSRGISVIDQYLLGRFHNYKHIIYHKTVRAAEMMFEKIMLEGLTDSRKKDLLIIPALLKIANKEELSLDDYLSLDDDTVMAQIRIWADKSNNDALKDLCRRLIDRNLFKAVNINIDDTFKFTNTINAIKEYMESKGLREDLYFLSDISELIAYKNILDFIEKQEEGSEIFYFDKENNLKPLSLDKDSIMRKAKELLEYKKEVLYSR